MAWSTRAHANYALHVGRNSWPQRRLAHGLACHHVHKPTLPSHLPMPLPQPIWSTWTCTSVSSHAPDNLVASPLGSPSASAPPFGIAWPLAKTGSAQTHMPRLPWHSGAQETLQIHLRILPRILPGPGSPGLFHLWVMAMGTIVTLPCRSATLHRFPLAIVHVVGCDLACDPRHHPLAPCAVEDHAPCVRTLLMLRLPRGPLAQAQGVHPWLVRPPARPCPCPMVH